MNVDRKSDSNQRPNKPNRSSWEMFALWSFVIFCFAALLVAGYAIWAKCHRQ